MLSLTEGWTTVPHSRWRRSRWRIRSRNRSGRNGPSAHTRRRSEQDEADARNLSKFFFDTPRDPRTGTPAKIGWTTKVDACLKELTDGQARIERAVLNVIGKMFRTVMAGSNFRGAVDRRSTSRHGRGDPRSPQRGRVRWLSHSARIGQGPASPMVRRHRSNHRTAQPAGEPRTRHRHRQGARRTLRHTHQRPDS